MNLGRIFANAIVRRLAYVLVAIALAWLGIGRAEAAQCGFPTRQEAADAAGSALVYQYEGQARAACMSMGPVWIEASSPIRRYVFTHCDVSVNNSKKFVARGDHEGYYGLGTCGTFNATSGSRSSHEGWQWTNPGCPPGEVQNPDGTCGSCESRAPLSNVSGAPGGDTVCDSECKFQCDSASVELVVDGNRRTYCAVPTWSPTGEKCSNTGPGGIGPPGPAPTDSDGDGTSDDNDSAPNNPGRGGAGEGSDGNPSGGSNEDSDCGGEGQPACGAVGAGSGNGNTSGGGGDCSRPPSSKGDPIAAQIAYQAWATRCAVEGMRGDMKGGQGINVNVVNGNGGGDGNGDGNDPGAPGDGVGDLYEPEGKTMGEVYDTFKDRVSQAPIIDATTNFMTISVGGSCPTFTLQGSRWWQPMLFDFHCTGTLATILSLMGWLVLAIAAYCAIRIATE